MSKYNEIIKSSVTDPFDQYQGKSCINYKYCGRHPENHQETYRAKEDYKHRLVSTLLL